MASSLPQAHSEIEMENQCYPTTDASSAASCSFTVSADPITSTSTSAGAYGYDVFINHRGPDTKKTFASYLYRRLLLHGLRPFLDQQELQEGLYFPSQIRGAIRSASIHVAVFSPKYAESQWCLEELLLMRESGASIIPVFYHVTPADLRWNNKGVYAEALQQLERKKTYDSQTDQDKPRYESATIQNWRDALSSVADISGFDLDGALFNGDEGHMLDKVVERVVKMAKNTRLYVAKHPTGLEEKVKDFETTILRQRHTGKAQVVGMVGFGGVGKTTLAKEFFNRKRSEYSRSCLLSDVRENAKSSLHSLQRKLLKELSLLDQAIDNIHQGTEMLRKFLSCSQVLLVLDDIDREDQVDALLPDKDGLHPGSFILITSRDKGALTRSGVEESYIYKLTGLTTQHSRELFCSYAFCQHYPLPEFENLVDKFLMACNGLPLLLRVFGALVSGKGNPSYWEQTLLQVPSDVHKKLKVSYDALNEDEQQIFLDIACFFIGHKKKIAIRIWDESRWKGLLGLESLENKCLVEVDSKNVISMHDSLRDLGREIAEASFPVRLWQPDLFHQKSSTITQVRGIRMLYKNDKCSWSSLPSLMINSLMKHRYRLHNTCYRLLGIGVVNLQLLETEGYLLERILRKVHSPNLIWLSWLECPYYFVPSWIPMKNLTALKVQGMVLKTLWQGESQDHGNWRNLKHLDLSGCCSLERLPVSFGNLTNLQYIDLSECRALKTLPDSFGNLRNLQHIYLSFCWKLKSLPDCFGNLSNLQRINLFQCQRLENLPDSFGNLRNLQHINLSRCRRLKSLPEWFENLSNLQHINLSRCSLLERLPDSFGNLRNLQHIDLSQCWGLNSLPDCFGNMGNLQHINLSQCSRLKSLPYCFGNLSNLQRIDLSGCGDLERLPDSFGNLRNLQQINLSQCCSLERLPDSFGNLTNLQYIDLSGCSRLKTLPDSPTHLPVWVRAFEEPAGFLSELDELPRNL